MLLKFSFEAKRGIWPRNEKMANSRQLDLVVEVVCATFNHETRWESGGRYLVVFLEVLGREVIYLPGTLSLIAQSCLIIYPWIG